MKPAGLHAVASVSDALRLALHDVRAVRGGLASAGDGPLRAVPAPGFPSDAVAAGDHAPAVVPPTGAAGADGLPSKNHTFGAKTDGSPGVINGPGAAVNGPGAEFTKSPSRTTVA
jgi:hypothetical protein